MDCLIDYIGIKDCGDIEPASGIYINTLPGIRSDLLQKIADGEQDTFKDVWADVQRVAALRFQASVIKELRKRYKLSTVSQKFDWIPASGGANEPASANLRGAYFQFENSFFTFQALRVAKLYFRSPDIKTNATFKFTDSEGTVLFSKTANIVAGLNEISIDKTFAVKSLFVGIDATTEATQVSDLTTADISCYCNAIKASCYDCDPTIAGYTLAGGVLTKTENNTHGIGILGYVGCEYSSIVCYNKELFSSAWLFLLGNQILIELLGSDRVGKPTTVDRKQYEELRDYYQLEYEKEIQTAVDGINISNAYDCCLECSENPQSVVWLP